MYFFYRSDGEKVCGRLRVLVHFQPFFACFLSWYEYLSQILLWYQVGQHCFVFGVWVAELSLTCWHQECVFLRMLIRFSWEVCNACLELLSIVDHLRWDMIKVWLSCLLPVESEWESFLQYTKWSFYVCGIFIAEVPSYCALL